MSKDLITVEMFRNINYDTKTTENNNMQAVCGYADAEGHFPTVVIVFANSDINAVIYHLRKSLESPFKMYGVTTVLVQESIKEDFIEKLQLQLKPYDNDLAQHKDSHKLTKALQTAKKLNARIITVANDQEDTLTPFLVCDFTHEQLGCVVPSGAVTLHTFRTAKEAVSLVNKESLTFYRVSIWHENHSYAYEIISLLKTSFYVVNCLKDPIDAFKDGNQRGEDCVYMSESYHYETFTHEGILKSIIFPIGSIFAN